VLKYWQKKRVPLNWRLEVVSQSFFGVLLIVEDPTVKCRAAIHCAVPLLECMSKCNVEQFLMSIYIHIFSYYKLFLYFNVCLSVMLNSFSCPFISISFLTNQIIPLWINYHDTNVLKNVSLQQMKYRKVQLHFALFHMYQQILFLMFSYIYLGAVVIVMVLW
jgi:hypothetical protein